MRWFVMIVRDLYGNNAILVCPSCEEGYIISSWMEKRKGPRPCPFCNHRPDFYFEDAKAEWEATKVPQTPVQHTNRLTFDKRWMGKGTLVQFTWEGATYRYHHDDLLRLVIQNTNAIEGTESWEANGLYTFPRLSNVHRRLLEPYRVAGEPNVTGERMTKEDFEGVYRIARMPARAMAEHNERSWQKVVAYLQAHGGEADFDALCAQVTDHEHGTKTAQHPYQFITYLIRRGLLERVEEFEEAV
jgi:hypothetical protein